MQLFECLLWILGMMVMTLSIDQACTSATLSSDFEASLVLCLTVISCWLTALLAVPVIVLLTA